MLWDKLSTVPPPLLHTLQQHQFHSPRHPIQVYYERVTHGLSKHSTEKESIFINPDWAVHPQVLIHDIKTGLLTNLKECGVSTELNSTPNANWHGCFSALFKSYLPHCVFQLEGTKRKAQVYSLIQVHLHRETENLVIATAVPSKTEIVQIKIWWVLPGHPTDGTDQFWRRRPESEPWLYHSSCIWPMQATASFWVSAPGL